MLLLLSNIIEIYGKEKCQMREIHERKPDLHIHKQYILLYTYVIYMLNKWAVTANKELWTVSFLLILINLLLFYMA